MASLFKSVAAWCLPPVPWAGLSMVWLSGSSEEMGITAAAGVKIAPGLTPAMLYPRIVWGGDMGCLVSASHIEKRYILAWADFQHGSNYGSAFRGCSP